VFGLWIKVSCVEKLVVLLTKKVNFECHLRTNDFCKQLYKGFNCVFRKITVWIKRSKNYKKTLKRQLKIIIFEKHNDL